MGKRVKLYTREHRSSKSFGLQAEIDKVLSRACGSTLRFSGINQTERWRVTSTPASCLRGAAGWSTITRPNLEG